MSKNPSNHSALVLHLLEKKFPMRVGNGTSGFSMHRFLTNEIIGSKIGGSFRENKKAFSSAGLAIKADLALSMVLFCTAHKISKMAVSKSDINVLS
jgi:hypothetical protein